MNNYSSFALSSSTDLPFETAIEKLTALLKAEGFGILTQIDVQSTLKEKIGADFRPFRILGACNPPFAHKALSAIPEISVLLPCNVVVSDEGDRRAIYVMNPLLMKSLVESNEVANLASEIASRLDRVLQNLNTPS